MSDLGGRSLDSKRKGIQIAAPPFYYSGGSMKNFLTTWRRATMFERMIIMIFVITGVICLAILVTGVSL